uniref:Uncharacterized protein n=1 Tax=Rhizophora mucronata TaxID=61149 RepID=A0A2P2QZG1_RHIMU
MESVCIRYQYLGCSSRSNFQGWDLVRKMALTMLVWQVILLATKNPRHKLYWASKTNALCQTSKHFQTCQM